MQIAPAIGIDLGTTNSCAAIYDGQKPRVIQSTLGYSTIPSVLTFSKDGAQVVGQQAERQMVLRPRDCIYGSKRLLGRAFSPAILDRFQPHFAYQLVPDDAQLVAARIGESTIRLVEVAALILKTIRDAAESSLGQKVTQAVVTVPAYFHENQRGLIRQAGQLADLEVLRIVNEPTAAALCFGVGQTVSKRVLVFDLGGGTFDVSIVDLDGGNYSVVGVDGDTFLGGLDFDRRLAQLVRDKLSARAGHEVVLDAVGNARLMVAVRDAKHQLSANPEVKVEIRCMAIGNETVNVEERVTAEEYIAACNDLLTKIRFVVKRIFDRARLRPTEVDEVLLVGGQTRMPAVQQLIRELLDKEPNKRVHPDEVVALGAAIVAYSHTRQDSAILRDMLPMPLGTAASDGRFQPVIQRNTPLPIETIFRVQAQSMGPTLRLPLFQGDGSHVLDNEFLGAMLLDDLPGHGQEAERIITLRLDAEGLLTAAASSPDNAQERSVELITNCSQNELIAEIAKASLKVIVQTQPAPAAVRKANAPSPATAKPAAQTPQRPSSAATARKAGSAKREAPRSFWQRLFGWFRG